MKSGWPIRAITRLTLCVFVGLTSLVAAQDVDSGFKNGGFEQATDGAPEDWRFIAQPAGEGQSVELNEDDVVEGKSSARIQCEASNKFTNLMQSFPAESLQGKRVRFQASVKTADLAASSRVQLWFRVDRPNQQMGAFDNMQDRPIRDSDWTKHEIVLDVADDATLLNVGIFVIGKGTAWIDAATFEAVDKEVKTTELATPKFSSELQKAFGEAKDAPQQPFFTPWLWPAVIAITLFLLAHVRPAIPPTALQEGASLFNPPAEDAVMGAVPKFALRFSAIYWPLYCLPFKFSEPLVRYFASNALGISKTLVLPNGSGDTTFSYVQTFLIFVVAIVGAIVWTLVDRRKTDYRLTHDLLRSGLRYVLATIMLSYGLAKVGWHMNQFPMPGARRLAITYGESSPMGILWTFMGASRAYTIFAGLGEVVGGVLLLFRRTATLGAVVVFGVMTNVMMMNFCYDVPVKLYATHMVVMAIFILMPDIRRLVSLFILNRPADAAQLTPPYVVGTTTLWVHRLWKVIVVGLIVWTIGSHVARERSHWDESMAKAKEAAESDSLLMNRGFRWINEVPFNR
ncbi:MAG: hypothetical protein AAF497_16175 [Planctomycetota bacterium]